MAFHEWFVGRGIELAEFQPAGRLGITDDAGGTSGNGALAFPDSGNILCSLLARKDALLGQLVRRVELRQEGGALVAVGAECSCKAKSWWRRAGGL